MGRHFEVRAAAMAKTAAAKAKVYSRYGKEIYVAAKNGVPDPDMNAVLKKTIERAKANQVPGSNENYTSMTYEGFGAGGSATIIVECLSDNSNRTIADLRGAFNKSHAKMGVAGSVSFNYDHVGMLVFDFADEEAMLDALIMADVDVKELEVEDGKMTVTVEPTDLYKAKDAIDELIGDEVKYDVLEPTMLPHEYVELEGEDKELFERLLRLLDDVDDVQNVYHNVSNVSAA